MRQESPVLVERCEFVYRRIGPALAASAALSALLSAALWSSRPKELIVFWQLLMLVLIFASAALWWAYRRAGEERADAQAWTRRIGIAAAALGAGWGFAAAVVFPGGVGGAVFGAFMGGLGAAGGVAGVL